ncbi:MAG TPA: hypothetical protein VJ931_15550, partial [Actinomycetota bacterium]|nr:hypothetical protein [Actinomycetota bacterium]
MSQQQRPAWTGGSDEALVPLGRGDEQAPATERDGRPADDRRPAERTPPPVQPPPEPSGPEERPQPDRP